MKLEEMKYFVEIVKARSINQASKTFICGATGCKRYADRSGEKSWDFRC